MTERQNSRYFIFHRSIFSYHRGIMYVETDYLNSVRDKYEVMC